MSYADYVYQTKHDSVRVRVFRRATGNWDFDFFIRRHGSVRNYSSEAGDIFATKREALAYAAQRFGPMKSVKTGSTWTGA
jgi:hypothetical protein